jgi:hypothetical protein
VSNLLCRRADFAEVDVHADGVGHCSIEYTTAGCVQRLFRRNCVA